MAVGRCSCATVAGCTWERPISCAPKLGSSATVAAVLLGRVTPVVRSFISIPAGILATPFGAYVVLTAIGSAVWCFGFAAGGWALGGRWKEFHDSFRYADYVVIALVVAVAAFVVVHLLRSRSKRAGTPRGEAERISEQV